MAFEKDITDRLEKLQEKYGIMGQDLESYMDGLLFADPVTYWDYLNLGQLLNLQQPKTAFPDEKIFIMYHQITELYFKLVLSEYEQICNNGKIISDDGEDQGWNKELSLEFFIARVKRINNYFDALINSFTIMIDGMERDQFVRYRMSLLPASGFQSAQYRMIELASTDLVNIIDQDRRSMYSGFATDSSVEQMFEFIYWRKGAIEKETGQKTLTLKLFEKRYKEELLDQAKRHKSNNLWRKYVDGGEAFATSEELKDELRALDLKVNVFWPLAHYKSAVRYLNTGDTDVAATGGTNWQKYLPPRFQKRIFFPELWTDEQKDEWGKSWVESVIK